MCIWLSLFLSYFFFLLTLCFKNYLAYSTLWLKQKPAICHSLFNTPMVTPFWIIISLYRSKFVGFSLHMWTIACVVGGPMYKNYVIWWSCMLEWFWFLVNDVICDNATGFQLVTWWLSCMLVRVGELHSIPLYGLIDDYILGGWNYVDSLPRWSMFWGFMTIFWKSKTMRISLLRWSTSWGFMCVCSICRWTLS